MVLTGTSLNLSAVVAEIPAVGKSIPVSSSLAAVRRVSKAFGRCQHQQKAKIELTTMSNGIKQGGSSREEKE
jgi:hypothetical protein